MWKCTLDGVAAERAQLLVACEALDAELATCEPVTKEHQISSTCCRALRAAPAALATLLVAERHAIGCRLRLRSRDAKLAARRAR